MAHPKSIFGVKLTEEHRTGNETCVCVTLSTTNPTWTNAVSN